MKEETPTSAAGLEPVRARIVDAWLFVSLILAAPVCVLSVWAAVRGGIPRVAWASVLTCGWLCIVRFGPNVRVRVKAVSLIVVLHLTGVSLLLGVGPVGTGLTWLTACTVTAALLLSPGEARTAFAAQLVTIGAVTLLYMRFPTDAYTFPYNGLGWFAAASGSLLLGAALSAATSTLVADLGVVIDGLSAEHARLLAETARRAALEADLERRVADRTSALTTANAELHSQTAELHAQRDVLATQKDELHAQAIELEHRNLAVERADRLKSEFLSNMSHELRTPLSSVIGFSDLLLDNGGGDLTARQRSFVESIGKAGRHQLSLITDILDLSKIEAGHLRLSPETIGVTTVLAAAHSAILPQAHRRQITVTVTTATRRAVHADAARLHQILLNLLSNAVKFSPERSTVEIAVTDEGPMVVFKVSDRGPGLAAEMWSRLFQSFQQAESPLVKRHDGTGLGLAISRRLVEAHGGRIEATAREGGGLVLTFSLPAAPEGAAVTQEPARSGPHAIESAGARASNRETVLLVDDQEMNRSLGRAVLQAAGFLVLEAIDAPTGIDLARERQPALILMDLAMPGMDGMTAIRTLKAEPSTATIPVIALTALAMVRDEQAALAAGADAYATKPIDGDGLVVLINRLIQQARGGEPPRLKSS